MGVNCKYVVEALQNGKWVMVEGQTSEYGHLDTIIPRMNHLYAFLGCLIDEYNFQKPLDFISKGVPEDWGDDIRNATLCEYAFDIGTTSIKNLENIDYTSGIDLITTSTLEDYKTWRKDKVGHPAFTPHGIKTDGKRKILITDTMADKLIDEGRDVNSDTEYSVTVSYLVSLEESFGEHLRTYVDEIRSHMAMKDVEYRITFLFD